MQTWALGVLELFLPSGEDRFPCTLHILWHALGIFAITTNNGAWHGVKNI